MPKISVITICRNARKGLEKSLDSLRSQTFGDYEHIVIDGASTDGSVELIERDPEGVAYFKSEPDDGISDAFNKGISASNGEYLVFLNAGDVFSETTALTGCVSQLDQLHDIYLFNPCFTSLRGDGIEVKHHGYSKSKLYLLQTYPQPTSIYRRGVFSEIGAFNRALRYTMDTEFLIRAENSDRKIKRCRRNLIVMERGGVSDAHFLDTVCEGWRMRRVETGLLAATAFATLKTARRGIALAIK